MAFPLMKFKDSIFPGFEVKQKFFGSQTLRFPRDWYICINREQIDIRETTCNNIFGKNTYSRK